jgi:secernin
MCDTIVIVRPGEVLFAKNSDRDPNEAQLLDWQPRQEYTRSSSLHCTWIEIPQVARTNAVLLSRPFWMWGAEMGANEFGVVIGNEAVFTREKYARTGLTGMDLVRLGLERAGTARSACEVIANLLAEHGQGGACGLENKRFTYHNSFLIADQYEAFVLETAGTHWAFEPIVGARSISNGLTMPDFARRYSARLKTRVSSGKVRQARTQELASKAQGAADMFASLRDHASADSQPHYSWVNGGLGAPCVHGGGLVAAAQTTASWVSVLRPGNDIHWVTGTASPCTGLFKPVRVLDPLPLGPPPTDHSDSISLWWRHERFSRQVLKNPARLMPLFQEARDKLEKRWLQSPPTPMEAFSEGDALLNEWTAALPQKRIRDNRPWWVRRYWKRRNRWAGI